MKRLLTSLTSLTLLCSVGHAQEREPQRDRPAAQRPVDWDQIKKRIEGAVERGEMTRDQANAKYTEIKKNLASRDSHPHDHKPDRDDLPREARLRQLLGRLVESQQISREVAVQIHQLAFEGREEGPGPRQQEHLGKLAGELERLIDRAQHELKAIEETRHRLNGEGRQHEESAERRRAEMERDEAMKRHQLAMREKAEAHAREMQQKHMMEVRKKQEAEARERAEKEKAREKELREKEQEKEKKRGKEEKKNRE